MSELEMKLREIEEEIEDGTEDIEKEILYNVRELIEEFSDNEIELEGWGLYVTDRNTIQLEKSINDSFIEIEMFEEKMSLYVSGKVNVEEEECSIDELIDRVISIEED